MEKFHRTKYIAYKKYQAFNSTFGMLYHYTLDLETYMLYHGDCSYRILPVATVNRVTRDRTISSEVRVMNVSYLPLYDLVDSLGIPRSHTITTRVDNPNIPYPGYSFSYILTAILCNQVRGKTFFPLCIGQDVWLWLIVIQGDNIAANSMLQIVEHRTTTITTQEAKMWYNKIIIPQLLPLHMR